MDRRGRQEEAPKLFLVRRCYVYGSDKHLQCSCPSCSDPPSTEKKRGRRRRGKKSSQVSVAEVSHKCRSDNWVIDSGASQHVVCHRNLLTSLETPTMSAVFLANSMSAPIEGEGDVKLQGFHEPLKKILNVSQLRYNLLSVSALTRMKAQ